MYRTAFFALFALTSACTAEVQTVELDDPAGTTELPREGSATSTGAALRPGLYDSLVDGVPVNACGDLDQMAMPRRVVLDWIDTDVFTWLDGTECQVWGDEYACDMTVNRRSVAPDTQLVTTTHTVGHILDEMTLEEEQDVRVACEGSGCEAYGAMVGAQFPCEMLVETSPSWRGQ